jgi:hypothetical protein
VKLSWYGLRVPKVVVFGEIGGVVGTILTFGLLRWLDLSEQAALMVLVIGIAFVGLTLVSLVAWVGFWLERYARRS